MGLILLHIFIGLAVLFAFAEGVPLFSVGTEFKYHYETLVTAGSEAPLSFASAYKLKGTLVVSADSSTTLNVKLDDLSVGLYNGKWSYFPIPEMNYFSHPELAPLAEPFQINVENGKVKSILLDDQEPEWASNMKRGLATYLQLDLENVNFNEVNISNKKELTTMGECRTKYEVLPSTTTANRLTRINKFRNHADCPDVPRRTRYATHIFYPCVDQYTRDIMNSTAYSTYEMEVRNGQPLLKQLTLFSSVLYWPFTSEGPYQFSWVNMTLSLESSGPLEAKPFPAPPNSETHEDLSYVFEQSDPNNDPEDENPELTNEVIFFHHITTDSDPEIQTKTMGLLKVMIRETAESLVNTETFFMNQQRFHSNSPNTILPLIASLDYASLKQLYAEYEAASTAGSFQVTELQLFLDGLIMCGTTPSTLMIRDILLSTADIGVLTRLAPSLPHFIRNPTEALAIEMDPLLGLLNDQRLSSSIRRTVTFSLASLIGRCCRRSGCVTSGLLDKYINYFQNNLILSLDFEERTVALLGLRNLRVGKSLDQVLDIAGGKLVSESPLRVQAVWSLRSLYFQDPDRVLSSILPVFYNRSESCQLRTSVLGFVLSVGPDEKLLHDMAYFMWTETCPDVPNILRSHLINAMNANSPCGNKLKTYARTILRYLPPGEVDPLKFTSFQADYYDRSSGFGHQLYLAVQKSGKTAVPVSVYLGLNNYMGGYASSYFGIFVRMEGVEKAIANELVSLRSLDVSKVKEILSKVGVTSRATSALYLEFTVVYHDYALHHYAVDAQSLAKLPQYLKSLGLFAETVMTNWERSVLVGGIFQEFPLEIGTPVSLLAGVTGMGSIAYNSTRENTPLNFATQTKMKLQLNLFGISRIANHAPGLGTMHSVTTHRGLRMVLPDNFQIGLDSSSAIKFVSHPPTGNNPVIAMAHGTSLTAVQSDSTTRVKDDLALTLLQKSCSHCQQQQIISRGPQYRRSRTLKFPSIFRGLPAEVKYFDCERDHSRTATLQKISKFFQAENQNSGIFDFPLTKVFLSLSYARDYIFVAPHAETCGIYARLAVDDSADIKLERVEGQMKGGLTVRDANNQDNFTLWLHYELNLKFIGSKPGNMKIKYNFDLRQRSIETKTVSVKAEVHDEVTKLYKILCFKLDSSTNRLPKDFLSFEDENEPKAEQRAKFSLGTVPESDSSDPDPPCLDNEGLFDISAKAARSQEQKVEAASDQFPYGTCNSQKRSQDYPGNFVPPTAACHAAAFEQTTLRSVNVSIKYKISEDLESELRRPANILLGLGGFVFSSSPNAADAGRFSHSEHLHGPGALDNGRKYFQGQVDLDMNLNKEAVTFDLHFHDVTNNQEEHFHELDLSFLPNFLRVKPVSSRMSPLWTLAFSIGAVSHCSVTPASVNTLDGFKYSAPLSDCWTLLSGDCGVNAQFLILAKKISNEKIGILVQLGQYSVEFGGDMKPIIYGKQVTLEDRKIFRHQNSTQLPFDVFRNGEEGYVVSRSFGIYVRYTGHFVTLTLDSRYRGVTCGVCGHWDSSDLNDLVSPLSTCPALLTPAQMNKAYVVTQDSCSNAGTQCPSTLS